MNATVVRPPGRRRVSFTLPYDCNCGRERVVLARNIATNLPISDNWRTTGACSDCGVSGRWRIVTREKDYLVQVEADHGVV
jgi:hypothetical protein